MVNFKIEGAREMERLLKQLGPEVANKVGVQAARAGAKPIVEEARRLVPIATGRLRDAIAVVAVSKRRQRASVVDSQSGVLIGFLKPHSRRAHLTEFGTAHTAAQPFMRPAMDAQAQAALDAMGRTLARGITREATKLARGQR